MLIARRPEVRGAAAEATSAKVLAYVRSNAGRRLEEIGRGLRTDTAVAPVAEPETVQAA